MRWRQIFTDSPSRSRFWPTGVAPWCPETALAGGLVCGACGGLGETDRGFACPACMCLCCEFATAVTAGLCRDCHVSHTTPAPCEVCGGSRWMLLGMLPGGLPLQQRCTACATPVARLTRDLEA